MNPREVYGMLKEHHEKTGRIMAEREMALAAWNTDATSLVRGIAGTWG